MQQPKFFAFVLAVLSGSAILGCGGGSGGGGSAGGSTPVQATPTASAKTVSFNSSDLDQRQDDTRDILAGDVDHDGDLDLLTIEHGGAPRLYLNDGRGRFSDVTAQRMPAEALQGNAGALVDVNGDARLDLFVAVGDPGSETYLDRLYINDGAGFFRDETAQRLPVRLALSSSVAAADVDQDGDTDLIVGALSTGQIAPPPGLDLNTALLLNQGGVLVRSTTFPSVSETAHVIAADLDGDGDLDLHFSRVLNGDAITVAVGPAGNLRSNFGAQNLILAGDGRGGFGLAAAPPGASISMPTLPAELDQTYAAAAADLDGDRQLDLVLANAGIFESAPSRVLRGGRFAFAAQALPGPTNIGPSHDVAIADFNADGRPDVFLAGRGNQHLFLGDGLGAFTHQDPGMAGRDLSACVAADLDGDGRPDLAVASRGANAILLSR